MDLFVQPVTNHKSIDESKPMGFHRVILLLGA